MLFFSPLLCQKRASADNRRRFFYRQDVVPDARPTLSKHSTEAKRYKSRPSRSPGGDGRGLAFISVAVVQVGTGWSRGSRCAISLPVYRWSCCICQGTSPYDVWPPPLPASWTKSSPNGCFATDSVTWLQTIELTAVFTVDIEFTVNIEFTVGQSRHRMFTVGQSRHRMAALPPTTSPDCRPPSWQQCLEFTVNIEFTVDIEFSNRGTGRAECGTLVLDFGPGQKTLLLRILIMKLMGRGYWPVSPLHYTPGCEIISVTFSNYTFTTYSSCSPDWCQKSNTKDASLSTRQTVD